MPEDRGPHRAVAPAPRPALRTCRAALLVAYLVLALDASALLPLWEAPGEAAAVRDAQAWAGGKPAGPTSLPSREAPPSAVLPRALLAGGLRAAGLQETRFLARPNRSGLPRDAALWLHGSDERLPWAGPARGLHLLRLVSLAFGVAAVLGAHALARRLVPDRPGAALLATALCALSPPFLVATATLGGAAPAVALATWSLVALADLVRGPAPSRRRGLLTGALLGLAVLAGAPAAALVPLAPLSVLLRRARGARWRESLRPLDPVAAGFLVVVGPLLAFSWAAGADASRAGTTAAALPLAALITHELPRLAFGLVGLPTERLAAGPPVLLLWSTLAALGALGLLLASLCACRGRPLMDGRVALLLLAALLGALIAVLSVGRPPAAAGRDLLPLSAAASALVAAGCAAWLPASRPRLATACGALVVAALPAAAAWHVAVELGPAFHPLNRVLDPHLLCFDPIEEVPDTRRLPTIAVLQPHDGESLPEPPELRWTPVTDPQTRYSVHLLTPGAAFAIRTFEDAGVSLRDRYQVPADLWEHMPPDVDLVLRAVRLPTLDEALAGAPLLVDETPPVRIRRELPGATGPRR